MDCGLLLAGLGLKIARPHSDCNKWKVTALQYSRSASTLGSRCKNYNNLNTLPQNARFTTIHTSFCQSDILPSTYSLRFRQTPAADSTNHNATSKAVIVHHSAKDYIFAMFPLARIYPTDAEPNSKL